MFSRHQEEGGKNSEAKKEAFWGLAFFAYVRHRRRDHRTHSHGDFLLPSLSFFLPSPFQNGS